MSLARIYYVSQASMPTTKAHGLTIAKSCESFAQSGIQVSLIVPRRFNQSKGNLFDTYAIDRIFQIRYLPVIDLLPWNDGRIAFLIQTGTFYVSLLFFMLFKSRKDVAIYARDPLLMLLSYLGFKTIYECHHIFGNRNILFWLCRRAARIVTISQSLKDMFVAEGFESSKILVAPSGVDLAVFNIDISKADARAKLDLPHNARIVMYTGNFTTMGQDKGMADIIASLNDMREVVFVAVGGNEPDMVHYGSLARTANLTERVIIRGNVPQSTLALYQQAADVLLMPFPDMPHYRNHMSPVKMFEYMASGRPIIASDLPTIREVLNKSNAIIVLPNDPHALAAAIISLLDDSKKAESLARQARIDVERYTWKSRSERILSHL